MFVTAAASIFLITQVHAGGEMKKVCSQDAKTKKEVCKMIKVHKKLEGTKVPPK
jgi:hypothetical protein